MVKVKQSKHDVRETQRTWTKKLEHVQLNALKHIKTFAKGTFGTVSLVQLDGQPDTSFALKKIQKAKIKVPRARLQLLSEKKILSEVHSDFIVKLYRTFKNNKHLCLLMEYLPGGELFDLCPMPENDAKFYIACVVEALSCLHAQDIAHNDLKLGNVVIDADGYAKLIDFGFARKHQPDELSYSTCGTKDYIPPEVVRPLISKKAEDHVGRDRSADLWALGVLVYSLVTRKRPFIGDLTRKTPFPIATDGIGAVEFNRIHFSEDCEDFIKCLCTDDPDARLGYEDMDEVRQHRWFKDFDWTGLRDRSLPAPKVPKIASAVDTGNFREEPKPTGSLDNADVTPSVTPEDESDWDVDF